MNSDRMFLDIGQQFAAIEAAEEQLHGQIKAARHEVHQLLQNRGPRSPFASFGPFYGFHAGIADIGWYSGWRYWIFRCSVFLMWHLVLKRRPGGNDMLICRWMISRCDRDAETLLSRLHIPGPISESLCWALNSCCLQYKEFRDVFGPRLREMRLAVHDVEALL